MFPYLCIVEENFRDLVEGDIVKAVKVCMVCVQQDRNGGFHVTSIGGMGTSFCTYTEQALVG